MNNQDHILTVSKSTPKNPETFNVDGLMKELYIYVKQELQDRNKSNVRVELCKLTGIEKCLVHTDLTILRQIFINLLDNAIQRTFVGCIFFGYHTPSISVISNISFFVEDTGNGIYNDVNLDLSIAQGLVKQLGGKMEIRSTEDTGVSINFNIICKPFEFFEN